MAAGWLAMSTVNNNPFPFHLDPTGPANASLSPAFAVVRIRPTSSTDSTKPGRFTKTVVHPVHLTTLQIDAPPPPNGPSSTSALAKTGPAAQKQTFTFDRVVGPDEGQEAVYEEARALVESFMSGLNVTILAYGQTSSGKSYTMGTDRTSADDDLLGPERLGITPRAVAEIFERIQVATKQSAGATTFQAKVSAPLGSRLNS